MNIQNNLDEFGTQIENKDSIAMGVMLTTDESPANPSSIIATTAVKSHITQYSIDGLNFYPTGNTTEKLPPGAYIIDSAPGTGLFFTKKTLVTDDLIKFEDGLPREILNEIETFWNKKELFNKYKFLHKRGILLYGPQGHGKSCLVSQIMEGVVHRQGIVILGVSSPYLIQQGLTKIREIEPETPIVVVFEDIDATIKHWGEQDILSVLDGEAQIDNVLNLATTNYPERLEKRIVNRPRRFDRVIKIGKIDERMRRAYFTQKLSIDGADIEKYVVASDGFSFAAMAELVIATKCLGLDFDEVVKKLASLKDFRPDSEEDDEKRKMGF